jgi:hypothetical protein
VALYLSRETWALEPEAVGRTLSLSRTLRDATDLDFVTRRSLADGHLRHYSVLVLAASSVLEPESAEAIEKWVRKGGILIAATRPGETLGGRLYEHTDWRKRMLSDTLSKGALLKPELEGEAPSHWVLNVGSREDEGWLDGDWHLRESGREWADIPDATMRWSGARPGVWVPMAPGAGHTLRLSLSVPQVALGAAGVEVSVNGQRVGRIERPGRQECAFAVPAALLGSNAVARLELAVSTWTPSALQAGNTDTRDLGVSVRQVEVLRAGAEQVPAAAATLRRVADREALRPLTRVLGSGMTIFLQGLADDEKLIASVLPGATDGRLDRRYATLTDDGMLWLDADEAKIRLSTSTCDLRDCISTPFE